MRKLFKWLYREFAFPPRFDVEQGRGCYLLYDGYRTGDHAYDAVKLRKIAWQKHDKLKAAANAS